MAMNSHSGKFGIVLFSVLASYILRTLIQGGYFNPKVLNHNPGPCTVYNVEGAECVQILDNGLAFFSSGTRYAAGLRADPRIMSRKGHIYLFDMNDLTQNPIKLELKSFNQTGFNPHGISVYKSKLTGVVSVFVVNHRPDAQAIEIFDFDEKTKSLELRRSVVDGKIHSPNDIVAVGPDSFYVTNDRFFHFDQVFLRLMEVLFFSRVLKSGIVYFDGNKSYKVAGGMVLTNGIAQSKDGRYIFVSAGTALTVDVYRKIDNGFLELAQRLDIGTGADNVNVDQETGDLWLPALASPLDFLSYNENIDYPLASQVLHIKLGEEDTDGPVPFPYYEVREVYKNNGSELRGATGADGYKELLAVGGIFDKFMVCKLKYF